MAWTISPILMAAENATNPIVTLDAVNVSWNTVVSNTDKLLSLIAIILSVIGLLYTRKSLRAPSVLAARKEHTEQMREFLKEWCKKIPIVKAPIHEYSSEDSVGRISEYLTANWKYEDLIGNHLPKEYKNLPNGWNQYINNVSIYKNMCDKLYNIIKDDLLEGVNLEYDPDVKRENIITKYFISLIYSQHVYWIKNKELFYQKDNICTINGNNLFNGLNGYLLARGDYLIEAQKIFEKMMLDPEYLVKYEQNIDEIIHIDLIIKENEKQVKNAMQKMMGHSLLPGTKCNYLRSA